MRNGNKLFRRLSGASSGGTVENTESIHMVMITYAMQPGARWYVMLLAALASISLVAVQVIILCAVILETGAPTCEAWRERCPGSALLLLPGL